jgi:hypothetical protein
LPRRQRILEPLQLFERIAPVGVRLGIVRPRRDRAVVARQRLLELLERRERIAAIVQGQKIVRASLQGKVYPARGLRVIAALIENNAEQVQAVEMVGPDRKNLIVDFFRIRQSAGLMQRQSISK